MVGNKLRIVVLCVILLAVMPLVNVTAEVSVEYFGRYNENRYLHSYDLSAAFSNRGKVFWCSNSITHIDAQNFYFSCLDGALYTLESKPDGMVLSAISAQKVEMIFSGVRVPYLENLAEKATSLNHLWFANEGLFVCVSRIDKNAIVITLLQIANPEKKKEITVQLSPSARLCINYIVGGKALLQSSSGEFAVLNLFDGMVTIRNYDRPFSSLKPIPFSFSTKFWETGQAIAEREGRLCFRDNIFDWENGFVSPKDMLVHVLVNGIDFAYSPSLPIGMQYGTHITANLQNGEKVRLDDFITFDVIGYRNGFVFTPSSDMILFDCNDRKFTKVQYSCFTHGMQILYASSPDIPFLFAYDFQGSFLGVSDIPKGVLWLGVQDSIPFYRLGNRLLPSIGTENDAVELLPDDVPCNFQGRIGVLRDGSLLTLSRLIPLRLQPIGNIAGLLLQISSDHNHLLVEREKRYFVISPDGEEWEIRGLPDDGIFSGRAYLSKGAFYQRDKTEKLDIGEPCQPIVLVDDALLYLNGNQCLIVCNGKKNEIKLTMARNHFFKLDSVFVLIGTDPSSAGGAKP